MGIIVLLMVFGLIAVEMHLVAAAGADAEVLKIKKQEEEKKKDKKSKVFTNADLEEIKKEKVNITEVSGDPTATANTPKNTPAVSSQNKAGKKPLDPMLSEEYWRDKKKEVEEKTKILEYKIKNLEISLKRWKEAWWQTPYNTQRLNYAYHIYIVTADIETLKGQIKKLWDDFYEEARKGGALPGWLRD